MSGLTMDQNWKTVEEWQPGTDHLSYSKAKSGN